jgi:hypothetical protein
MATFKLDRFLLQVFKVFLKFLNLVVIILASSEINGGAN